jgi:hypothetical protein
MNIKNMLCAVLMMSAAFGNSFVVAGMPSSEEIAPVAKGVVAFGVVGFATVAGGIGGVVGGAMSDGFGGAIKGAFTGAALGGLALFTATYAYMGSDNKKDSNKKKN